MGRHDVRGLGPALMAFLVLLYVPFAGNGGLWDPWETHYGEVARQMAARGDVISLHYPCSPLERAEFYSKPVLTFWLEAPLLRLLGLVTPQALTSSWRAEWAARAPSLLLGLTCLWAVFVLVRRLAGARAALLSALVLATCPGFLLVARQAMTDLPFVAPMTIALVYAGLALLDDDPEAGCAGPRAALLAALAAFALLPIVLIAAQLQARVVAHGHVFLVPGALVMLPYALTLAVAVAWIARLHDRRRLYLASAWLWCGVATLAKGPAGLALPGLAVALYLTTSGRPRALLGLELGLGALVFVAVAFPWYHAMLARHGAAFFQEFIGDNYLRRALGRHGDRGGFEYYLGWLAYGGFPWSGLAAAGVLRPGSGGARGRLRRFALCWIGVDWAVLSLVVTKFHHYALPMLPAVAILTGLYLDELVDDLRAEWPRLLVIALPITLLSAIDLCSLPQRSLWLFNYDYVNMPGLGRPWPSAAIYGGRYDYASLFFAVAMGAALALVAGLALLRPRALAARLPGWLPLALLGAAALAIACGPSTTGPAPHIEPWRWLLPAGLALGGVASLARAANLPRGLALALAGATLWCTLLADKMVVELSPHWSQKHVLAAYYARRRGPEEPLLVWELFWHGENFYTANQIYDSPDPAERTVFLGDRAAERLRRYLDAHRGRRLFFLVERQKLAGLRGLLPPALAASLAVIDESNNKLVLASAGPEGLGAPGVR